MPLGYSYHLMIFVVILECTLIGGLFVQQWRIAAMDGLYYMVVSNVHIW